MPGLSVTFNWYHCGLTYVSRFGSVHLLLQLVPVLNMFFLMTTAVGSGLYSVKEEERRRREEESSRPHDDQHYVDSPI
jgi:hypothetical protein